MLIVVEIEVETGDAGHTRLAVERELESKRLFRLNQRIFFV